MELHWAWCALAIIAGVYRMIAVCFEAAVRRTVQIARQPAAEPDSHPTRRAGQARGAAPPGPAARIQPGEGWARR